MRSKHDPERRIKLNFTIFDTPIINTFFYIFSTALLKATGWRAVGRKPAVSRFVLVGAPHTSNWDLPYALIMAFALRIKINWMGKDVLFLVEERFNHNRADWSGYLSDTFSWDKPEIGIETAIRNWLL